MKSRAVKGLLLLGAFMAGPLFANGFVGIRQGDLTRGADGARSRTSTPVVPVVTTTVDQGRVATCNNENREEYVSLGFLHEIMEFPEDIRLERVGNQVHIQLPSYLQECLDLEVEYRNVQNNVVVALKNSYSFPNNDDYNGKTLDQKYAQCLREKNILVEVEGEERLNLEAIQSSPTAMAGSGTIQINLNVPDTEKSMKMYFASPAVNYFSKPYGEPDPQIENGFECLETEKMFPTEAESYAYISEEDRYAMKARTVCAAGDYKEIERQLRELRALNGVGNANFLISVLEKAFDKARDEEVERIYEELERIEDKFKLSQEDIEEGETMAVSEREARRLSRLYGDRLEELNEILFGPSIRELNALLKKLDEGGLSDDEEDEINERIAYLNDKIGHFADTRDQKNLGKIFAAARYYGLENEALKIQGFWLKSEAFGRVYAERRDRRGDPLTIAEADEEIVEKLERFETRILEEWDREYRARTGDSSPVREIRVAAARRYASMRRGYQRFQESERRGEERYCSTNFGFVRNPQACARHRQSSQQRLARFQNYWNANKQQIDNLAARGQQYQSLYDEFERRRIQDQLSYGGSDPFGFYGNDLGYDSFINGSNDSLFNLGMNNQFIGPQMPGQQLGGGIGQPFAMPQPGQFQQQGYPQQQMMYPGQQQAMFPQQQFPQLMPPRFP